MIFIGVGHLIIAEMTVIYIHKRKHKKFLILYELLLCGQNVTLAINEPEQQSSGNSQADHVLCKNQL